MNNVATVRELSALIDNAKDDFVQSIKITGVLIKQILQGYSLKTVSVAQYNLLLKRELIRKSIYAKYPHRNPELNASYAFKKLESKMIMIRKQINSHIHDNSFLYRDAEQFKKQVMTMIMNADIEISRKKLFENLFNIMITRITFPMNEQAITMITEFITSMLG
jgi:hypothetical protein